MLRQRMSAGLVLSVALLVGSAPARGQTTLPSYPAGTEGLTQFFTDMLAAAAVNDQAKLLAMSESLVLPDPVAWFTHAFGPSIGPKLAESYQTDMKGFGPGLAVLFLRLRTPAELNVSIVVVETPDNPNAKVYQRFALEAMKNPTALYAVSISKEGTSANLGLWSIVHSDGQFRLAGKMLDIRDLLKEERDNAPTGFR